MELVLAGSHQQFIQYCHEQNIETPMFRRDILYINDRYRILGVRRGADIVLKRYGTWRERTDTDDILELANAKGWLIL